MAGDGKPEEGAFHKEKAGHKEKGDAGPQSKTKSRPTLLSFRVALFGNFQVWCSLDGENERGVVDAEGWGTWALKQRNVKSVVISLESLVGRVFDAEERHVAGKREGFEVELGGDGWKLEPWGDQAMGRNAVKISQEEEEEAREMFLSLAHHDEEDM